MSESKSNQHAATPSKSTASSNIYQPRQRMAHNYLLLWVDNSIGQTNEDYENTLGQIQNITGGVNDFTQRDACIDFLTDAQEDIKSILIVNDTMFEQIMPLINDIPQLDGVYIFNNIKTLYEQRAKKCDKIKSIHAKIDDLCQALQMDIKQFNQDSIAMSFITINDMASAENLNQLEPTFMYTQLFKEILLDMEHNKQAIKDFITYSRDHDCLSPKYIDRFEKEYSSQLSIWWYTFPSDIYSMLNYGLRTMNADIIITMGFFLRDVHEQIQQLYQQQVNSYGRKSFVAYRGQGLMKSDFEKLQKTNGGLMSFNNFLSTSTNKEVSLGFARCASTKPDTVGILFIMSIDPCVKSVPFASLNDMSYFTEEDEILFSMHTVFRVNTIKIMDNENQLHQVELQLTSDDDQQLRTLTDRIRKEASGSTGWKRLGRLLLKIGQFNKAKEFYDVLLEQTSDESEKALYYGCLGYVTHHQGDHEKAIWYYEQGLEIRKKTLPSNHPHLATSYNNIGGVYVNMGEYSKALSFYEKALEIEHNTLPSNHPHLATQYNNIGAVYKNMGEYTKILSYYEKAREILQKSLPSNHPDLATSSNNIGMVYHSMGEYFKALSFFEKALEIYQKALPPNHPDLANSYNNIGMVYHSTGEYFKAFSFFEKALEIRKQTLPSNHPDLATSFNNIGMVYHSMGEYAKALSSYKKALEIQEKALPPNHPHLANSYSNIGGMYVNMGEYSKTLSYYQKALEIREKTLPSNHLDLAISYGNNGLLYDNMKEHSKALSFYEKALEIQEKNLAPNHPDLATSYNNIGGAYNNTGDHSKALSFYKKALRIRQKTLLSNHPDLANSYNNIGSLYDSMREYSEALSYYEKALEIQEKNLAPNHPHLATSYNNMGNVYKNMEDYSKTLSNYEKALEVRERSLPSNDSSLATSYSNIGIVYTKMKEYSKALSYYEKALEIYQKTFPANHPDLATSFNNIGFVYANMKDYSKALSYYERTLNILQSALPPTHPHLKSVKERIEVVKKELIMNS
ncbi:unnamed protein product [Adineta steineri]|uniref:NAD(P)(+)--arginine ADP-ribosyltransferase n=1 Tax=Adineta steineri TaxID=433720 RepID=A0A819PNF4_9BILA|nr:unnamed protein product [Adineta steineri]CAF4016072.1 unnamed protein product [Adineta steineri]